MSKPFALQIVLDLMQTRADEATRKLARLIANERDARLAIEMPPGGILTCLTRQAAWEGESVSLERSGIDVAVHLARRLKD